MEAVATDWKNCDVSDCEDGTWRAAVKRYGVMVVQYGDTADEAFDKLADLVSGLDKNRAARTDAERSYTIQNKSVKV